MASNVLTSYGASNLQIEQDYNLRFNEIQVGDPEVTVQLSGTSAVVSIDSWYHATQEETARWRYVGMDYATAQSAADSIRADLTFSDYAWQFGTYISGDHLLVGYYKDKVAPKLESDVTVVKSGPGAMYDVLVDAHVTLDDYAKLPGISTTGSHPLADYLANLTGWSNYPSGWADGWDSGTPGADNIVLVSAPTRTREFELVGTDVTLEGSGSGLSSLTFPTWYKCVDHYSCQIRYEGLTLGACRTLRNSLNGSTGWWLSAHPWVYQYVPLSNDFEWVEDGDTTTYQCLNEFKASHNSGNMWSAELSLRADVVQYVRNNPTYAGSWAWPSLWSTRIPGLANYL